MNDRPAEAVEAAPASATELAAGLAARIGEAPWSWSFYQAMRSLEARFRDRPGFGRSTRPRQDPVRLGQDPAVVFAPATLAGWETGADEQPDRLLVNFFGLFGPDGPLPLHLTEYARDRRRNHHDPTFQRFADIFHHRLISLFYRAWANARPTVSFDRPEQDRFALYVGALMGLGADFVRHRDAMPDLAKLHFVGHLGCQTRHAEGLAAILSEFFRMPVRIECFIGGWLPLDGRDRTALGDSPRTSGLGQSIVLGARVWSRQHKFRVVFGPLGLADYLRLLPGGTSLHRLIPVVRNYAGDVLIWDVNLILKAEEVPPLRLGRQGRLGWTTWLVPRRSAADAADSVSRCERRQHGAHRRCPVARPARPGPSSGGNAMSEISRATLFGKLDPLAFKALEGATVFCKLRGNPYVELVQWLHQILQTQDSDLHRVVRHFSLDASRLAADLTAALDRLPRGATAISDFSPQLEEIVERGWVFASLMFGEPQVRTGHLLYGALRTATLRHALYAISRQFEAVKVEAFGDDFSRILAGSPEAAMAAAQTGAAPGEASGAVAPAAMGKQEALRKFSVDLTERAREGKIDPIVGRDQEIRQVVDMLMRRRQNNPILTGRGGRRQDRRGRGFRAAHCQGRRAAGAEGGHAARARCRPVAGRREHEGRVREPAAPGDRGGAVLAEADHPVHRRGAHADRRGRRRRDGRRREPAQARARARHAAHDRRHHLGRIQEVLREGPGADPPLPGRAGRRAGRGEGDPDAARHRLAAGKAPSGRDSRRGDRGLGAAVAPLHSGAAIAGQGGQPARHRVRRESRSASTRCRRRSTTAGAGSRRCETELDIIGRETAIGIDATARDASAREALSAEQQRLEALETRWGTEKALVDRVLALRAQLREGGEGDRRPARRCSTSCGRCRPS